MRLEKLQKLLTHNCMPYTYAEEDGCGSIDLVYRGVSYHVWEFEDDGIWGAETNLINSGRPQDLLGDYEEEIIGLLLKWPGVERP